MSGLKIGGDHLGGELATIRPMGRHPGRVVASPPDDVIVGAAQRSRDHSRPVARQQIAQPVSDERSSGCLEHVVGGGVRADDGSVPVDEQEAIGKGVEYGGEVRPALE
ncbi:hypothetical protein OG902_08045 [Streptomyces sp. NBC_01768]|nr:hypothetical protein [Streptomyces sp. NBC_01768]WSC26631.1 hypothetical protein OG902_08045 [Streptomyces sp. NBC_01768]